MPANRQFFNYHAGIPHVYFVTLSWWADQRAVESVGLVVEAH
jgi:hypothetical protein